MRACSSRNWAAKAVALSQGSQVWSVGLLQGLDVYYNLALDPKPFTHKQDLKPDLRFKYGPPPPYDPHMVYVLPYTINLVIETPIRDP